MKLGAPAPNMFVLIDSQSAKLWIFVANNRGYLNEGGMNQPVERPGKIKN